MNSPAVSFSRQVLVSCFKVYDCFNAEKGDRVNSAIAFFVR
jgi:hypothetical protein